MINLIAQYLLLLFPLVWELITDSVDIRNGIEDRKGRDVAIRIFNMLAAAYLNHEFFSGVGVLQHMIYSYAIFYVFFDYALNAIRGKNLLYLGKNPSDMFKSKLPIFVRWFAEVWVLIVGWAFYYTLDKII